jgi:hypothetical protein
MWRFKAMSFLLFSAVTERRQKPREYKSDSNRNEASVL